MKRVIWAEASITDLNDMKTYLAENYSALVAEHVIGELIRAAWWLTDFPNAGPQFGIGDWRKWRTRKGRHILIYDPKGDDIHVLRVRHERNDWRPVPLD